MQIATTTSVPQAAPAGAQHINPVSANSGTNSLAHYQIIRRNGAVVPFEPNKIAIAMMKAFLAVHGTQGAASASVRETVDVLTQQVVRALVRSRPGGGTFHIEDVQDAAELGLMRSGHHEVARAYVLYRERRAQERAKQAQQEAPAAPQFHVLDQGQRVPLDVESLKALILASCEGLGADVKPDPIYAETQRNLYDGVNLKDVNTSLVITARALVEKEPNYSFATARLLLDKLRAEGMTHGASTLLLRDAGERGRDRVEREGDGARGGDIAGRVGGLDGQPVVTVVAEPVEVVRRRGRARRQPPAVRHLLPHDLPALGPRPKPDDAARRTPRRLLATSGPAPSRSAGWAATRSTRLP